MIVYNDFCFAAPPCTGVPWFVHACQLAGFGPAFIHRAHVPFPRIWKDPKRLHVTLVRHPCVWLHYIYRFLCNDPVGCDMLGPFNSLDKSSWEVFLSDYLKKCPGGVGEVFNTYQADSVIRSEDLPNAFDELLMALNIPCSLRWSASQLSVHHSYNSDNCMSIGLHRRVAQAEQELIKEYDYCV